MKVIKKSFMTVGLLTAFIGVPQGLVADSSPAENVRAVAEMLRAEADYARALAEARLNYARAELVSAEAAQEWERARSFRMLVDRQRIVLARLVRDEREVRRKIERAEGFIHRVNRMLNGTLTLDSIGALGALQAQFIPAEVVLEAMTQEVPSFSQSELQPTSPRVTEIVPFEGRNVGQLLNHLRQFKLTVEPWGVLHQTVIGSVVSLGSAAQESVDAHRLALSELGRTVDPFNLPERPGPPPPSGVAPVPPRPLP